MKCPPNVYFLLCPPNVKFRMIYIYIYIYIYKHIYKNLTYNKTNNGEKVNLFHLKTKIFMLIIYKINKYLKSVFTLSAFQDFRYLFILYIINIKILNFR